MTVPLCIRQGSKRNDDSVSVEELDWSAESPVLIPAEHFWCDFKCRPWAKNSSPNTNDLYIHYMDKSTGTPPSLEEKKALPNCGNKYGNIIHVLKIFISTSVFQQFWSIWNDSTHMYPYVIGVWSIIISLWSLPYTQRHCHVRIEKCSVQTVAIKLEAHNSLEYHYMLKY